MSKRAPRKPLLLKSAYTTSLVRCAIALGLVLLGIAWIVVFITMAQDAWLAGPHPVGPKPSNALPWMADLGRWNFLIGFGLIFLGLGVSAHPHTPLGRGRGVVVGMLFCFLVGLIYIVAYYFLGTQAANVPVMKDLDQYNLLVGIGFMAVGFAFATKWE